MGFARGGASSFAFNIAFLFSCIVLDLVCYNRLKLLKQYLVLLVLELLHEGAELEDLVLNGSR